MKHKFSVSLSLALIAVMLVTSLALADNVQNDVAANPGSDTFTLGDSTTVGYRIVANGQDGFSGCDASDGSAAVVTINAPVGVTPTPGYLTFTACDSYQNVTFTASAVGDYEITASVNDTNGSYNTNPAKFALHVLEAETPTDSTAPVISYTVNGVYPPASDGLNGWYVTDAFVDWTVSDPESDVTIDEGCVDTTIDYDTPGVTLTCIATSAGGTSSESVTIKRDATNPDVALVGGPADGSSHYFGFVPAEPTCDASDATSGLAGACSVSGYGDTVGYHTVTASAFDNAGNEGTDSASYDVLAWTLTGFYKPVDMGGVFNVVKGGSTVPLKFEIFAGSELTETSYIKSLLATPVACTGGTEDAIETVSTGGTSLRYDWTSGQFIFNWQTPKKPGNCYQVTMTTQDDSTLVALFKLK